MTTLGIPEGNPTTLVTAWHVETDAFRLRRLGKALEEMGELVSVLARCIIQGVDEVDPSSKKVNLQRMEEETADVFTQLSCLIQAFSLDQTRLTERALDKKASMDKWEELLEQEFEGVGTASKPQDGWVN